jgi:hypothetical protein
MGVKPHLHVSMSDVEKLADSSIPLLPILPLKPEQYRTGKQRSALSWRSDTALLNALGAFKRFGRLSSIESTVMQADPGKRIDVLYESLSRLCWVVL